MNPVLYFDWNDVALEADGVRQTNEMSERTGSMLAHVRWPKFASRWMTLMLE